MDEDCLFFPELYRIVDTKENTGRIPDERTLRNLVDLCTLCGLCPCSSIRTQITKAKAAFARSRGVPLRSRVLADLQWIGRACSLLPKFANSAASSKPVQVAIKKLMGIHPKREMPLIPHQSFFAWAKNRGLCTPRDNGHGVAYFCGCTAGYLFPEVARAAVKVLERNGNQVYVPPQACCGMPTLVEGIAATTRKRTRSNLHSLLEASDMGYQLVGSCPTCGYLIKVLLRGGAHLSQSYQRSVGAGDDEIKIPHESGEGFTSLKKSLYGTIMKDGGPFSTLSPMDRIALADRFQDIGEYLSTLLYAGRLDTRFHPIHEKMAYFAPCHQREQKIGTPYMDLLSKIPGLTLQIVGGAMDCCGMGGALGFKKDFYGDSVSIGSPIAAKIQALTPEAVVTDCLSCRLQFQHLLACPVYHPLEILMRAYVP